MTHHFTRLMTFCAAFALAGWPVATASAAGPRLVASEPKYDFGEIAQGAEVPFSFQLQNQGDAPLQIQDVRPSCGCTAALISANVVPPGGTATIEGEVKTAGLQDRIAKTITVTSNDPSTPRLTLTVTGVVTVPFHLEPRYVNFGQLKDGAGGEQRVVLSIKDTAKLPVTIEKTETSNPHVTMTVTPRAGTTPPDVFDITVNVLPDAPQGVLAAPLLVHLAGEAEPLRLSMYADVVGSVALYPSTVPLGLMEPGQSVVRTFVAMSPTETAFTVTDAQSDLPGSTVVVSPLPSAPQRVQITVTVDGSALPPGRINGTLTVYTDAPDAQVLTARLVGVVREPPASTVPALEPAGS